MELWSLLHFLMPHIFESHKEFKDWFSNPVTGMVEGTEHVNHELIERLHQILRPFLLRRLKRDVEKSLLPKIEHVLPCPLSKRQRELYEDYMQASHTRSTLGSGSLVGIMNVLMQLRKARATIHPLHPPAAPPLTAPTFHPSSQPKLLNGRATPTPHGFPSTLATHHSPPPHLNAPLLRPP